MRRSIIAWGAASVLGLGAALWSGHVEGRTAAIQQEIAGQVVRFHVLADSDRIEDQEIKFLVKERLLEKIEILLEEADSLEGTKEILKQNTKYLQKEAKSCLAEAGSTDDVTVSYETDYFPVKSYGDYTFPAGEYEALRVKIGRARGQNWWCMLYPSLCFEDALHPVLEEKENDLRHVLSDDAYDEIWKKEKIHFTFRWF